MLVEIGSLIVNAMVVGMLAVVAYDYCNTKKYLN